MTTTAPRTECSTCSAPRRGGALFCVRCGSPFEEASVRVPMPRVPGTSDTADEDLDDPSPTSTEGFPLPRPTPTGGFPAPHPSPVRGVPVPRSTGGFPAQRATGGFPAQQAFPAPHPGPYAYAPPAAPRRSRRDPVIVGVSLVVILLAGLAIVAVQPGIRARFLGGVEAAPSVTAPPQAAPAAPVAPAEPNAQLGAQAAGDRPRAEATAGSWVPQLSAKKVGLVADGTTYDDAAIWADHQQLRARYPDALLVWSSDYTSFKGSDFWITVVDRPFSSAAQANAWCDSAGLDGDSCYAKRLSHTGDSEDHTSLRTGASGASLSSPAASGSGGAAPSGGEPVVGWSGWVPGGKGWGEVRPPELNANGDGTSYVEGVTWDSWGGPTATGRGTAAWVPPNASNSDSVQTPAVVVASDLGTCHGRLGYRKLSWYFPSKGETASQGGYDEICEER